MSHFEVLADGGSHFLVHDHRDGTTLKVPKSMMPRHLVQHVQKLAEGGVVGNDEADAGVEDDADAGAVPVDDAADAGATVDTGAEPADAGDMALNNTIGGAILPVPTIADAVVNHPDKVAELDAAAGDALREGGAAALEKARALASDPVVAALVPPLAIQGQVLGAIEKGNEIGTTIGHGLTEGLKDAGSRLVSASPVLQGIVGSGETAATPAAPSSRPAARSRAQPAPEHDASALAALSARSRVPGAMPAAGAVDESAPDLSGYDKAAEDIRKGYRTQADLAAAQAKDEIALREKQTQLLKAFDTDLAQHLAANQARVDQIRQQWGSAEMNPSRFWDTRTTGQKASVLAGMILGGIGSALARQPNFAMQVIDKAINDDLRAQIENRNNMGELMRSYIQQGHDIATSARYARADMLDGFANEMRDQARKYYGPNAQAVADIEAAKLTQQSLKERADISTSLVKAKYAPAAARLALEEQRAQIAHLRTVDEDARLGIAMKLAAKPQIPNPINLPDGSVIPGNSDTQAKEANETMAALKQAYGVVGRIRALGRTGYGTTGAAEAKVLAGQLLPVLERIELKGSRNKYAMEAVKEQVEAANAGGWRQDRTMKALDTIEQLLEETQRATVDAYGRRETR